MAHGAERLAFIGFHAAVLKCAVHPLRHITAPFVHANALRVLGIGLGRYGGASRQHVLPFFGKILQRGDVLLPRLHIGRIVILVLVVVVILIGQPSKTVAKLVHHHRTEGRMVCGGIGCVSGWRVEKTHSKFQESCGCNVFLTDSGIVNETLPHDVCELFKPKETEEHDYVKK